MNEQEIFNEILKSRGIKDIDAFLNPKYEDLSDPLKFPDIKPAVKRIKSAIKNKEKVGIYGDYDIDGLSATTLLVDGLSKMGLEVTGYIPDRFIDGYGMSENGVDHLAKLGISLIITVDCGSRSEAEIAYAKEKAIDVIVTDHHEMDEPPASAIATINPKRKDAKCSFKERSGAGVAFALICALQASKVKGLDEGQEKWLLDLVALSTVADMVPLVSDNRILLKWGLEVLKKTKRPGIKALMQVSDFKPSEIDETKIGFRIGPRLNAAGRVEHGKLALETLMAETPKQAKDAATKLDELNQQRRADQDRIIKEAAEIVESEYDKDDVIVIAGNGWSEGVVGIVAANIMELTNKPTFVLESQLNGVSKGSARSFGDFDLSKALKKVKPMLLSGGGHKYAAGVKIKTEDLPAFRKTLNDYHKSLKLKNQADMLRPNAEIELNSIKPLTLKLATLIEGLAPFGEGNHRPVIAVTDVTVKDYKPVGTDKRHAKLVLEDADNHKIDVIGFSMVKAIDNLDLRKKVSAIGHVSKNEFNGSTKVQFELRDIRQV